MVHMDYILTISILKFVYYLCMFFRKVLIIFTGKMGQNKA